MAVSLVKGQKISLEKKSGAVLSQIKMGLGWDAAKPKMGILGAIFGDGNYTGYIMAKVYRHNGEWKMAALGEPSNGQTFKIMLPDILKIL
ncbi:MAG: TerD family protein [Planctomycetaceae bacterium]|nr:TerD family protein [Planctomycetaceae bacterium]